jgi:hypothetical protein
MSGAHARGDNPAGLADFEASDNPDLLKALREYSDRFRKRKGLPPLPPVETRADRDPAKAGHGAEETPQDTLTFIPD